MASDDASADGVDEDHGDASDAAVRREAERAVQAAVRDSWRAIATLAMAAGEGEDNGGAAAADREKVCPDERVLQFQLSSKLCDHLSIGVPETPRVLSNMWVPQEPLRIDGRSYPSVEHYFQCAKYVLVGAPECECEAFESGGKVGCDPKKAKKAGARKAFEAAGHRCGSCIVTFCLCSRFYEHCRCQTSSTTNDTAILSSLVDGLHSPLVSRNRKLINSTCRSECCFYSMGSHNVLRRDQQHVAQISDLAHLQHHACDECVDACYECALTNSSHIIIIIIIIHHPSSSHDVARSTGSTLKRGTHCRTGS
jgi:hypothetical protein